MSEPTMDMLTNQRRNDGSHEHEPPGDGTCHSPSNPLDTDPSFGVFALMAKQADMAERLATSFALQRQALLRDFADDELVQLAMWRLKASEEHAKEVATALKKGRGRGKERQPGLRFFCPDQRIVEHIDDTLGLGDACYLFLGLLPKWIAEFQTVGKLWAYCGLHVKDGWAPRRVKGERANWSGFLKAIAIARIGEPVIKTMSSPYRAVYDYHRNRKPPMWADEPEQKPQVLAHPDCPTCIEAAPKNHSCRHLGGEHWAKWHRHKHGQRVLAKQIVKDLWRVSRGHEPLFGGLNPAIADTHDCHERSTEAA